jgi:hypothetical protein
MCSWYLCFYISASLPYVCQFAFVACEFVDSTLVVFLCVVLWFLFRELMHGPMSIKFIICTFAAFLVQPTTKVRNRTIGRPTCDVYATCRSSSSGK